MSVEFEENNKVDDVVATITVQPKVTLVLDPNLADLFNIRGNQLVAARVFDFEVVHVTMSGSNRIRSPVSVWILESFDRT